MSLMWSTASHALGQRQPARTQTPTARAAPRCPIRCSISLETEISCLQSIRPRAPFHLLCCLASLAASCQELAEGDTRWMEPLPSMLELQMEHLQLKSNHYQPCMPNVSVAEIVHNAHAGRICKYDFARKIVVVFLVHFLIINIQETTAWKLSSVNYKTSQENLSLVRTGSCACVALLWLHVDVRLILAVT